MFRTVLFFLALFATGIAGADDILVADFETERYDRWQTEGEAFGTGPVRGTLEDQMGVSGYEGDRLVNSFRQGDTTTGTLTSPTFPISKDHLSFLIGGGNLPGQVGVELLIDGQRKRVATGSDSEALEWRSWNVREFRGREAQLRVFDRATGSWGHVLLDQVLLGDEPRERPVVGRLSNYRKSERYYRERYRPQYHFTPEINWINDPNGLVYFDGEYHMFFQHNPHGNEWGHMSWGHAVSGDLVHWQHLPIALQDAYGVMVFSGSAVFDEKNTSGFGTAENPPLVAIYTGHGHDLQTQDLAYSTDRGRTWTKYEGNPVLDIGEKEFRDPKVFWHQPTERWVMVVALAAQRRLQFYGSPNLKEWTLLSEFGPAGTPNKPNWECPDLFELPIENEPGKTRWVLEADMGGGSIAGGSGGEYFTGVFDGTKFIPDSKDSQWVDFGRDFYAPVSWNNVPEQDGRRLWLAWMNNWQTSLIPTYPWRGGMSIPRELTLRRINGQLQLVQRPVRELTKLRHDSSTVENLAISKTVPLAITGQQLELIAEIDPGTATQFGFRVLKGNHQFTEIGYDTTTGEVYVDRTRSGNVGFHPEFAGRHAGPLALDENGHLHLRILVDSSSVEVFGGHGQTVITDRVFPDATADQVEAFATGGTARLVKLTVHKLDSIWPRN